MAAASAVGTLTSTLSVDVSGAQPHEHGGNVDAHGADRGVAAMRWLHRHPGIACGPATGTGLWGVCHLVGLVSHQGARYLRRRFEPHRLIVGEVERLEALVRGVADHEELVAMQ